MPPATWTAFRGGLRLPTGIIPRVGAFSPFTFPHLTNPMMPDPSPLTDAQQQAQARVARSCLDLTSLGEADSTESTLALCARAVAREPLSAAVCVWPAWVATARAALPAAVRVAAVANFPHGAGDVAAAVADARRTADAGGQEVDLVLPWRALLAGDTATCVRVVQAVRQATAGLSLKLIIESGELRSAQAIQEACRIGLGEGVDMLKTSTGKTPSGADPQAARWMLECIQRDTRADWQPGFKASGGVRTVADAARYAGLVQELLGRDALNPRRFRIGASGLLDDIDAVLAGRACAAQAVASDGTPPAY
jgi:deoxyribose-phosphate aldolase